MFAVNPLPVRVLIVDDDDAFAALLSILLGDQERVQVVGRARDGAEGIALARALRPDVVLMDLCMPRMDGFEATRQITGGPVRSAGAVLVVSSLSDAADVRRAREAGAASFLPKDRAAAELLGELEQLRPAASPPRTVHSLRYAC